MDEVKYSIIDEETPIDTIEGITASSIVFDDGDEKILTIKIKNDGFYTETYYLNYIYSSTFVSEIEGANTISGQIFSGTGFSDRKNHKILGITKAYTTRVGQGPFPTELKDKIGEELGSRGNEFGTVTSRKRRCGWFDVPIPIRLVDASPNR